MTRVINRNPPAASSEPAAHHVGPVDCPAEGAGTDGRTAPTSPDGARLHNAATSGVQPRTDCRYWVRKTALPTRANIGDRVGREWTR